MVRRWVGVFLLFWLSGISAAEFHLVIRPQVELDVVAESSCALSVSLRCEASLPEAWSLLSSPKWQKQLAGKVHTVRVRFLAGHYLLSMPLILDWGSGKTAGVDLEISGEGAATVLSGAVRLSTWRRLTKADYFEQLTSGVAEMILVADVSRLGLLLDRWPSRGFGVPISPLSVALYQNDQVLPLARWPNEGYARLERPGDLPPEEKRTFRVTGRTGLEWRGNIDLVAHAFWFHDWAAQAYPVTVGREGRLVIDGDGSPYGIRGGQRLLIENALSELDSPGEWYLNRPTGELFAWLPQENLPVEMAVSESVFRIEKSRNIVIRDLAIEKVRGDAVRVQESENIVFENVSIRHTGNRALVVEGGRRNGIRNSLIEHNGEGGVFLTGGHRANLIPAGHFVENSTIRDFSRLSKTFRFAVEMDGVGQRVEGNKISEAPHTAILFLGNDHKILNNEIFNVVQETSDAGAIYVGRDFTSRGTVIEGNFLHDIKAGEPGHEVKGIYLDDQASGITIRNNIFARVQQPVFIGGGRDNVVENNVFYESSPAVHLDARGLNWQRAATLDPNNTLQKRLDAVPFQGALWRNRYQNLANIRDDDLGAPKYNKACGNVVVKGKPHSVAKEAQFGIEMTGFLLADEDVFKDPLPPHGRQSRSDFVLRSAVPDRCSPKKVQ